MAVSTKKINTLDNNVEAGDVVFQTGTSNRWQVLTLKGFRKRFPNAQI